MAEMLNTNIANPTGEAPDLPAAPGRILLFAVLALMAGIATARWWEARRSPTLTGQLMAETSDVTAPAAGILREIHADAGADVAIDQDLLSIELAGHQDAVKRMEQQVEQLESQLARAMSQVDVELAWRMKAIDTEIFETHLKSAGYLKDQYQHQMEKVAMQDLLERAATASLDEKSPFYQSMVAGNRIDDLNRVQVALRHETAANSAEVSQAQLTLCEARLAELDDLRKSLPAKVQASGGLPALQEQLSTAQARLESLHSEAGRRSISAPAVGIVGNFHRRVGDAVEQGEPIVTLLDDARRYVLVNVPSSQVDRLEMGEDVKLAFPGPVWMKGRVRSIAPQAITDADRATASDYASFVPVEIEQSGETWPHLPIGAEVDVCLPQ